MAIVKMKKMTVAIVSSLREKLIDHLQSLSVVHIDPLSISTEEEGQIRELWTKDLETVVVDVSNFEDQKKDLYAALLFISQQFKKVPPSFEITSPEMIEKISAKYDIVSLANELKVLEKQTQDCKSQITILSQELEQVKKWSKGIDNFDLIHGTCLVLRGVLGSIAESSLDDLKKAIAAETDLADMIICWSENKEVFCCVISEVSVWDRVLTIVKDKPFNVIQAPRYVGDSVRIVKDLTQEIASYKQKYELSLKEWAKYEAQYENLVILHDILEMKIQRLKAEALLLKTDNVSFFRAWVPAPDLPNVEAILSIYEKSIDVTISDPTEDEYSFVPVQLRNSIAVKPFSALTNMYGTPMYGMTVDPTPHLSIFYFIYYGICLGDALYGVLLALFSTFMMLKNRANATASNFYALLVWSGISALIAGVFFGSYAGDLFVKYVPVPMLMNLQFLYHDGTSFFDKPLFVLFISLLLGAVQLWYGYWIKFFVSLKNTGIQAIFNEGPWILLLSGFFGWAVFSWVAGMAGLTLVSEKTISVFFLLIKVGTGLVILNSVRKGFQTSILAGFLGPLAGAWELYGVSGYLSNLLSYARLLALGLSSGIIANVFNQLSFSVIEGLSSITPMLGSLGIVMLIVLHLFNLILGGFGAFVHALRLQFVEFFGQFIEGGGKDFKPLECKGSHYTVK